MKKGVLATIIFFKTVITIACLMLLLIIFDQQKHTQLSQAYSQNWPLIAILAVIFIFFLRLIKLAYPNEYQLTTDLTNKIQKNKKIANLILIIIINLLIIAFILWTDYISSTSWLRKTLN